VLWHPAHYALVANGADSDTFLVRAVDPYSEVVLWTFTRSGMNGLQLAFALALGEYGQVYAAGFGAGSFPAIAYIAG
jgi:ABC-type sulfate transport system permease component